MQSLALLRPSTVFSVGWFENIESPYVWAPLTLCVLLLLAFVITKELLVLYAVFVLVFLVLAADWIERMKNRDPGHLKIDPDTPTSGVQAFMQQTELKGEALRKRGKVAAADELLDNALRSIYQQLAQLADRYEELRANTESGLQRTVEMTALVSQTKDVTRRGALQALHCKAYLQSADLGRRIVGLGMLEAITDPSYFDLVIDKIADSESAFEQFHALVSMEQMVPYINPEKSQRLEAVLNDQMGSGEGKWIVEGTDRHRIASQILDKLERQTHT